jgi:hypothetical protein
MAAVAWLVNALCATLPLAGILLRLVSVAASIALAAVVFYAACRLLHINELDEAVAAVGGRFLRRFKRK